MCYCNIAEAHISNISACAASISSYINLIPKISSVKFKLNSVH